MKAASSFEREEQLKSLVPSSVHEVEEEVEVEVDSPSDIPSIDGDGGGVEAEEHR